MSIFQRIRNLWRLSEYQINDSSALQRMGGLVKSNAKVEKKMATVLTDTKIKKEPEPKEYERNLT